MPYVDKARATHVKITCATNRCKNCGHDLPKLNYNDPELTRHTQTHTNTHI